MNRKAVIGWAALGLREGTHYTAMFICIPLGGASAVSKVRLPSVTQPPGIASVCAHWSTIPKHLDPRKVSPHL